MTTTVLQISDPHFGTERASVLQALLELARNQPPELVVLSGDISQRARPGQFRAARSFIDQLQRPFGGRDEAFWHRAARCSRSRKRWSILFD